MEDLPQYQQDFSLDVSTHLRDMEERQRLLKDRILLIGESIVKERDRIFKDMQELKHNVLVLQQENTKIKELIERMSEQLQSVARKEELMILQRQFELFRGNLP